MELSSIQYRFCLSIVCKHLKGKKCSLESCAYPDKDKAIAERREAVRHGGSA